MIRDAWWTRAATGLACALALSACDGDSVPALSQTTDIGVGGDTGVGGGDGGGGTPDAACTATAETCNGMDDDCDGRVDEEAAEAGTPCGSDQGECVPGINVCRNGAVSCVDSVGPARGESCNGKDDDCDGTIDEDAPDVGNSCNACGGVYQCVDGAIACDKPGPTDEVCNGLDDDCDGTTDEALPGIGEPCGGVGECAPGVRACVNGAETCEGVGQPSAETCNDRDDDCDGTTDEDVPRAGEVCQGSGDCGAGVFVCAGGRLGCQANANNQGVDETCNGRDDDCDGRTDEADPQVGMACGSDVGACEFGQLSCIAGQILCFGGTPTVPETCDQLDNDCDGNTDEADDTRGGIACPGPGEACEIDRNCASNVCLSDYGTTYCSSTCDQVGGVGAAGGCPPDLTCAALGGRNVCTRTFPRCLSDQDCAAGEACQLLPAPAPDVFGGQCRPRFADGLPNAASCGPTVPDRCASGLCIAGPNTCGSLCRTPGECPGTQSCALTPFALGNGDRVELGLCLNKCTRDSQCSADGTTLCQYGRQADRAAIVGFCDAPYPGGPLGAACDYLANPPQTCDHGFCNLANGPGYCTNGCVSNEDCLAGWTCRERAYGNQGLTIGWCEQ